MGEAGGILSDGKERSTRRGEEKQPVHISIHPKGGGFFQSRPKTKCLPLGYTVCIASVNYTSVKGDIL